MKIRTDFITNSSSSSFVAFGVEKSLAFPDDAFEELFKKELEGTKEYYTEHPDYYEKEGRAQIAEMEAMDEYEREEYVRLNVDYRDLLKNKLLVIGGFEDQYIGMLIETILNNYPDLKVSELRSMVANALNKECGTKFTENDIEYIEEAWMDN